MNNNLNETTYKSNYKSNNTGAIIIALVIGFLVGVLVTVACNMVINKVKTEERKGGGFTGVGDVTTQKENTNSSSNNTGSNNGSGTQTTSDYDVSMFTEIDINGFMNLYNGSNKSVIYIGRATCGYCVKFLPSLQKAQSEFGYQTYYYDIDKLTLDDFNQIVALNSFLEENFGATPMVLVVQNGQIVSPNNDGQGWLGYNEYEAFKEYLQSLGY